MFLDEFAKKKIYVVECCMYVCNGHNFLKGHQIKNIPIHYFFSKYHHFPISLMGHKKFNKNIFS